MARLSDVAAPGIGGASPVTALAVMLGPFIVAAPVYLLLLRWYSRKPRADSLHLPVGWSDEQAFLDAELKDANSAQLGELSSYRTEALQLIGFAGVVATLTATLNAPERWVLIAVVVIFAVILILDQAAVSGRGAVATSFDPVDVWNQAEKIKRLGGAFQLPALDELRLDAFARRREAFNANQRRIRRRRRLLVFIRMGLVASVVISVIAASQGSSASLAPSPVRKARTSFAAAARHHNSGRHH